MQFIRAVLIFLLLEFIGGFTRYIFIHSGFLEYLYETLYKASPVHANVYNIAYMSVDYGTLFIMVGGIIVLMLYATRRESTEFNI